MSDEKWTFEMSPKTPDWEDWEYIPFVSLDALCCLALNVDPAAGNSVIKALRRVYLDEQNFFSLYFEEKNVAEKYSEAHFRVMRIILSNLDFKHGSIKAFEGEQYSPIEDTEVSLTEFVNWADTRGMLLPDGFPRENKGRSDSDAELKQAYRVIVQLLKSSYNSKGTKLNQGSISSEIGEKGLRDLSKRKVDEVFRLANKACESD